MADIGQFISVTLDGLLPTVEATVGGIVIATVLSVVFGLAMLSQRRVLRVIARIYVEIWRGTSEVVQLLWIFFVLPILVGYEMVPLVAGVIVLGLNFGAYGAEIVRGAVKSVPKAQIEGCVALSLTPAQRLRRVVLPQALVEMVPPMNNLFIQLLKGSSLLTIIGVTEMTHQAHKVLIPRNIGSSAVIWLIVLIAYLVLSLLITAGMRWLERWAAAMVGRKPAPRRSYFRRLGNGRTSLDAGRG